MRIKSSLEVSTLYILQAVLSPGDGKEKSRCLAKARAPASGRWKAKRRFVDLSQISRRRQGYCVDVLGPVLGQSAHSEAIYNSNRHNRYSDILF
jgi:hypothetical protein